MINLTFIKAGQGVRHLLLICLAIFIGGCSKTVFIDTFSTDQLRSGYDWFDEKTPDSYTLSANPGWLKIEAGRRQDLWKASYKRGAPLLLRSAPRGNYTIETFVSADPLENSAQPVNTQIGLFVFQDIENWLFFGFTNHDFTTPHTTNGLMVTQTGDNTSLMISGRNLQSDSAFLQIKKKGNNWSFFWKLRQDDVWTNLTTLSLPVNSHKVGVGVKTFDLDPPSEINSGQAYFDFFKIWK